MLNTNRYRERTYVSINHISESTSIHLQKIGYSPATFSMVSSPNTTKLLRYSLHPPVPFFSHGEIV